MDIKLFFATFVTIFLAELGDKTQFAAMAAGAQGKSTLTVVLAVVLALGLAGSLGVLGGKLVGHMVKPETTKWISGFLFIFVGLWVLFSKK